MSTADITSQEIDLNGHRVPLLSVSQAADPAAIVKALQLPVFKKVVQLFGGADQLDAGLKNQIANVLRNGLLPAAMEGEAVIVDGGTESGVMQLMGNIVAEQENALPLIGIAPEALVNYIDKPKEKLVNLDPNHSHFVLVRGDGDWGLETRTLFKVSQALALSASKGMGNQSEQKTVAILIGGGSVTATEILMAVRAQLTIIVVRGTGGFADQLSIAEAEPAKLSFDPIISEIIRNGDICFHRLSEDPEVLRLMIGRQFTADKILVHAWQKFADFDHNAGLQQSMHKWYQKCILQLGVVIAGLGILWQVLYSEVPDRKNYSGSQWLLYGLLIILPIGLTTLIAAANKFKNGMKWIFFRAAAEAIKREIYVYRTRTGPYQQMAAVLLSERISQIGQKAMKTDINHTFIRPYQKSKGFPPDMTGDEGRDDGFSRLGPEEYIEFRLRSQISFYDGKVETMNRNLTMYNWATYILSGLGTLLAVTEQQVWIALTTAAAAAIGNWLGYQQWDNTISKYNQGAIDLKDIIGWWDTLNPAEQLKPEQQTKLVTRSELALQNEYDGWAQQMQQTLDELSKQQQVEQQRSGALNSGSKKTQAVSIPSTEDAAKTKQTTATAVSGRAKKDLAPIQRTSKKKNNR